MQGIWKVQWHEIFGLFFLLLRFSKRTKAAVLWRCWCTVSSAVSEALLTWHQWCSDTANEISSAVFQMCTPDIISAVNVSDNADAESGLSQPVTDLIDLSRYRRFLRNRWYQITGHWDTAGMASAVSESTLMQLWKLPCWMAHVAYGGILAVVRGFDLSLR